jgi:hypothetical protein
MTDDEILKPTETAANKYSIENWASYLSESEIQFARRRAKIVYLRDEAGWTWPRIGHALQITHESASMTYQTAKRLSRNK